MLRKKRVVKMRLYLDEDVMSRPLVMVCGLAGSMSPVLSQRAEQGLLMNPNLNLQPCRDVFYALQILEIFINYTRSM